MARVARGFVILVLLALLAAGLPLSASATPSCTTGLYVETFEVTASARRDAYRLGQTALVDLWVTDKITGEPEEDVDVGILVEGKGEEVRFGVTKTDAEGHGVVRLRLEKSRFDPGWVRARVAAWDPIVTPVYCTGRYGQRDYPRLFRIRH